MTRWIICAVLTVGLSACQLNDSIDVAPEAEQAACTQSGGFYMFDPLYNIFVCVPETGDAGQLCTKSTQCEGWCELQFNDAPAQCSAVAEFFRGCLDFLDNTGEPATLCL